MYKKIMNLIENLTFLKHISSNDRSQMALYTEHTSSSLFYLFLGHISQN